MVRSLSTFLPGTCKACLRGLWPQPFLLPNAASVLFFLTLRGNKLKNFRLKSSGLQIETCSLTCLLACHLFERGWPLSPATPPHCWFLPFHLVLIPSVHWVYPPPKTRRSCPTPSSNCQTRKAVLASPIPSLPHPLCNIPLSDSQPSAESLKVFQNLPRFSSILAIQMYPWGSPAMRVLPELSLHPWSETVKEHNYLAIARHLINICHC